MTIPNTTLNSEVLFAALLIAGILFFSLSVRQWLASRGIKGGGSVRVASGYSVITVGIGLFVFALTSGPVPAKEIFAIPSDRSYDFYQVESGIQNPSAPLTGLNTPLWPGLESNRKKSDVSFMDAKIKDTSLIIDPGFRTSLTNRIIKVAGRIAWHPSFEKIEYRKSLYERGTPDMGQLNIERLTGVYELAWLSAYEIQRGAFN